MNSIKIATVVVIVLTLMSKILGFARDITLSYFFGASNISDAYLVSLLIPVSLFTIIGTGISTSLIPVYLDEKNRNGEKNGIGFLSSVLIASFIFTTILIVFILIFVEPIVNVFASGFDTETMELAIRFTQITSLGIYFSTVVYVLSGYLNANKIYWAPALIGIPLNIIMIISIVLGSELDLIFLPYGKILAVFSQSLFLFVVSRRLGMRISVTNLKSTFTSKPMKTFFAMALPIIVGVSVNQLNVLVDKTLASRVAEGGISALNYSNRLILFVQGVLITSYLTVIYPSLSNYFTSERFDKLRKRIGSSIRFLVFILAPITIIAIIYSTDLVDFLYNRGAFDNNDLSMTSSSLRFYSIGLLFIGIREMTTRAMFATKETKLPMLISIVAVLINIGLNFLLYKPYGLGGLAFSTSFSAFVSSILMIILVQKRFNNVLNKQFYFEIGKMVIASSAMVGVLFITNILFVDKIDLSFIRLVVSTCIGFATYLLMLLIFKSEEVVYSYNVLKKLIYGRKKNV